MNPDGLKEYLEIVLDMEKNLFLQKQAMDSLQTSINRLGNQNNPERKVSIPCPKKPEKEQSENSGIGGIIFLVIGILGGVLGVYMIHRDHSGAFGAVGFLGLLFCIFGGMLLLGGGVLCLAGLWNALTSISLRRDYEDAQAAYEKKLMEYEEALKESEEEYKNAVRQDKLRVKSELEYRETLTSELSKLKACYESSSKTLEVMYARNVIFPKYRNFVMLCSLYEYICAGRCSNLEGHEGAYNILELEIRMDRIVLQLDQIIEHLGTIMNNQYMLYTAVQYANEQTAMLVEGANRVAADIQEMKEGISNQVSVFQSQMEQIKNSSAITAYQAERMWKELHYMNRMDYLSGRNDGAFFNMLPY